MRRMPEFSAFDSAKSMMRVLPPKYTAGLARRSVNSISRLPRPPASTKARAWRARGSCPAAGIRYSSTGDTRFIATASQGRSSIQIAALVNEPCRPSPARRGNPRPMVKAPPEGGVSARAGRLLMWRPCGLFGQFRELETANRVGRDLAAGAGGILEPNRRKISGKTIRSGPGRGRGNNLDRDQRAAVGLDLAVERVGIRLTNFAVLSVKQAVLHFSDKLQLVAQRSATAGRTGAGAEPISVKSARIRRRRCGNFRRQRDHFGFRQPQRRTIRVTGNVILQRRQASERPLALPLRVSGGARIDGRRRRRRRLNRCRGGLRFAVQIKLAEKGDRQFGHLCALGGRIHGGADAVKYLGDIVLVLDVAEKRRRKGAVSAGAIAGDAPRLRGVGNDRAIGTLHLGEPLRDAGAAGRSDRALECLGDRIVATGVEHEDTQGPGLLQIGKDLVCPGHAA